MPRELTGEPGLAPNSPFTVAFARIVGTLRYGLRKGGSMKRFREMLIVSALAAVALAAPGAAQARVDLSVNVGPPAPIYEPVPPPRPGWVSAPGYWDWNGHRHAWHRGYWQRERAGYRWEPHHWAHHGDRWVLERGRWNRG